MPIYEITPESSMAFHPRYFDEGVKNSSDEYNYYEWNQTGRVQAAKQIKTETRKQPKAEEEVELDPQIRLIPPPGGVMVFSGAQFHSTVPNTSGATRYSIDLRTVHRGDLEENVAAPNVDSAPQGTTLRDFLHVTDLARLPEELVLRHDNVDEHTGVLIFDPAQQQT
jgi:ectoine hydroxylase-related dioxygenase (phytanoyl-CoA dioxygenase family)